MAKSILAGLASKAYPSCWPITVKEVAETALRRLNLDIEG